MRIRTRRNKYGAIKSKCLTESHGLHASRFESMWCNKLLAIKQNKEINDYATQVKFELAPGITHIVDFAIDHNDGSIEVIECKGKATAAWRIKKKLFEQKFKNIKYTVAYLKPWKRRRKIWKNKSA